MNGRRLVFVYSIILLAGCSAPGITPQQADLAAPDELCEQLGKWSAASMGGEANSGYTESSVKANLDVVTDAIERRGIDCTPGASIVTE
jgi:hypothetical protein